MRIYIKGPDGKPLMPKPETVEEKKEIIKEYILDILECVVELIPSEWTKTALYAEVADCGISFQIIYNADGYARGTAKAAEKSLNTGKIYEDRKARLVEAIKSLYEKYIEFGGRWEALSLVFGSGGEYTAEFIDKINNDLTPRERIEKWKTDRLKVRPKTDKTDISASCIEIHKKDDEL